jgi:hypothetical protein
VRSWSPTYAIQIGIHHEPPRRLREALVRDPRHEEVVALVVRAHVDHAHKMVADQTPEVLGEVAPDEGQAATQQHQRDVQVEVDVEVLVHGGRQDREAREEVVEQLELGSAARTSGHRWWYGFGRRCPDQGLPANRGRADGVHAREHPQEAGDGVVCSRADSGEEEEVVDGVVVLGIQFGGGKKKWV